MIATCITFANTWWLPKFATQKAFLIPSQFVGGAQPTPTTNKFSNNPCSAGLDNTGCDGSNALSQLLKHSKSYVGEYAMGLQKNTGWGMQAGTSQTVTVSFNGGPAIGPSIQISVSGTVSKKQLLYMQAGSGASCQGRQLHWMWLTPSMGPIIGPDATFKTWYSC